MPGREKVTHGVFMLCLEERKSHMESSCYAWKRESHTWSLHVMPGREKVTHGGFMVMDHLWQNHMNAGTSETLN